MERSRHRTKLEFASVGERVHRHALAMARSIVNVPPNARCSSPLEYAGDRRAVRRPGSSSKWRYVGVAKEHTPAAHVNVIGQVAFDPKSTQSGKLYPQGSNCLTGIRTPVRASSVPSSRERRSAVLQGITTIKSVSFPVSELNS